MDAAPAFAQGWLTMAGLIVAIGAQNAQVLRQGLEREHVVPVVALCTVSDWLLAGAGVFGLGAALVHAPRLMLVLRYGGAAFLLYCAFQAARRAWRGGAGLQGAGERSGRAAVLATTAVLTWLNPHVYLDTVVLLGAVGAQQPAASRAGFAAGAGLASLMWFSALGFGAAALSPWLARPATWRAIDTLVALAMASVAWQLLVWRP